MVLACALIKALADSLAAASVCEWRGFFIGMIDPDGWLDAWPLQRAQVLMQAANGHDEALIARY